VLDSSRITTAKTLLEEYGGERIDVTGRGLGLPGDNAGIDGKGLCYIGQQPTLYTRRH